MTTPDIETLFRQWWAMSYPTPPGVHAVSTHTSFGAWLLEQRASTDCLHERAADSAGDPPPVQ